MGSSLLGRLSSFVIGFGTSSIFGAKIIYDEIERSNEELMKMLCDISHRVDALEKR